MSQNKETILKIISVFSTLWGLVLLIGGDLTNGSLVIIIGYLISWLTNP